MRNDKFTKYLAMLHVNKYLYVWLQLTDKNG